MDNDALKKQVLDQHDIIMLKMNDIVSMRKELKALSNLDNENTQLVMDLDSADEHMMEWMAKFNSVNNLEGEEIKLALELKMRQIIEVGKEMDSSIMAAKKYLNLHGIPNDKSVNLQSH